MCKFYLLIFFIIGANCDCIPPILYKEIRESYAQTKLNFDFLTRLINLTIDIQTSAKPSISTSVTGNKTYICDFQNQSSLISKMFESNFYELQKNLMERTEQIIDQKFASISEYLHKSALNTDNLQASVDQLSASGAQNMKYNNNWPNQSFSNSKMLEKKLDKLQRNLTKRTEQLINQKFASISEDLYKSALITDKLQASVDQLSASAAQNMKDINNWPNQSYSNSKMFESNLDELQRNLTERTEHLIDQKLASISENLHKSALNTDKLQASVDQLSASVAQNMKYINNWPNQSYSNSKMFESNLDELQRNLTERTEQLINQKFASISENLHKSALNTDKLQASVDQLSASVSQNMKYINNWPNQSYSNSKMFESSLDELQRNLTERIEQLIDQKFAYNSEDLQNSASNMSKLPNSVDKLSKSVITNKKNMKEENSQTSSILKIFGHKLNEIQNKFLQFEKQILADDCSDLNDLGLNVSKSHLLPKFNRKVLCDLKTDGGRWLVIQKRRNLTYQVNFNRNWASYKEGFGDLDTEFWIGNEFLHRITNQKSYELRIDMEDFVNGTFYATYSNFRVGNEESRYKLYIGGYEGNAQDRLEFHNKQKFSTFDRDNDNYWFKNCAKKFSGGFWYKNCYEANLNGVFPTVPDSKNQQLIRWKYNEESLLLIKVEMKIRPKK